MRNPSIIVSAPKLREEEILGLRDYWHVYESHREEIDAALLQRASRQPEISQLIENGQVPLFTTYGRVETQRRAIQQNEWQPYLNHLWEQGKRFAQAGINFHIWFELIGVFRELVRPYLLESFGDSPERLLRAMTGADNLVEIAMSVIGESYLDTKQQLIREQEQTIRDAQEREHSDEKFRGLVDMAPDPVVVVDDKGRIVLVNAQFERVFGYSRSETIGQTMEMLVPHRFHDVHPNHRRDYYQQPRIRPMGSGLELNGLHKDGHEFPVEISLSPLQTEDGVWVTAAIRDITERKLVEEKISTLNKDLEQRAQQLEAANKELEAFSYSVSHDLRAPLRTIDGFSQALLEDYGERLDDEGRNYLMRVRTAAQRMAQLIDDLLNLSRLTRAPLNAEDTNLSTIAQRIIQDLQSAEPNRIVDVTIVPNMVARSDPRLMKVVLENLISNAWKYTSRKEFAQIEFGSKENGNKQPVYFVRDNGAGFDMAYANKLFGVFQRLHTTSEFPGIGIGLAIVQRIINRHGGQVWAEGTLNEGAIFYFSLWKE